MSRYDVMTLAEIDMDRSKLVNIENSRDIRLTKLLLEAAGLIEKVEIEAAPGYRQSDRCRI